MSAPAQHPFTTAWPALPASVPAARHRVLAHLREADTGPVVLDDVALAVSEAATNVVLHAYGDDEAGEFRIIVDRDCPAGELRIRVEDDGAGIAPRADSPGAGLGLPLIATVTSRFATRVRDEGGTRLCMCFGAPEAVGG